MKKAEIKLRAAKLTAARLSREAGIAYVHEFADDYQASIAKRSGKNIIHTFKNGGEII